MLGEVSSFHWYVLSGEHMRYLQAAFLKEHGVPRGMSEGEGWSYWSGLQRVRSEWGAQSIREAGFTSHHSTSLCFGEWMGQDQWYLIIRNICQHRSTYSF